ncbi:hypothetical protein LY76DRAFT_419603 [Colletotrichum caudatum]|nr:hypothetical protein LY76DRAFT_419603 [Colletotrichum caudatum]
MDDPHESRRCGGAGGSCQLHVLTHCDEDGHITLLEPWSGFTPQRSMCHRGLLLLVRGETWPRYFYCVFLTTVYVLSNRVPVRLHG